MLSVEQCMLRQQNHSISIIDESLIKFIEALVLVSYLLEVCLNFLFVRNFIDLHLFSLLLELK